MKARQLWCTRCQLVLGLVLTWFCFDVIAVQPAHAQEDDGLRGGFAALSLTVKGPNALSDPKGAINWQSEIHGQIRVEAAFRDRQTTEVKTCDAIEDYGFNKFICRIYLEPLGNDETYWDYAFSDFITPGNVCIRRIHSRTGAIEERGCNLPLPFSWHFEGEDGVDFDVPVASFVRSQEKLFDELVLDLSPISVDAGLFARIADLERAGALINIMRKYQTLRLDLDFLTTFQPSEDEVGDDGVAQKPTFERHTLSCLDLAWGARMQVELWLGTRELGNIWSKELALAYKQRCFEEIAKRTRAGGPLGVFNRDPTLDTTVRRDCRRVDIVKDADNDFQFDCHALSLVRSSNYPYSYLLEKWVFHHRGHPGITSDADNRRNCISVTRQFLNPALNQTPETRTCDPKSDTAFLPY